jgi:hypothetical protein
MPPNAPKTLSLYRMSEAILYHVYAVARSLHFALPRAPFIGFLDRFRLYRQTRRWYILPILPLVADLETLMAKELKNKRDEAKQAWENATFVMKKAKKADDFTGSKKAHDEAEKLRVEYLKAETASETDSDDSENRLAMSAHR